MSIAMSVIESVCDRALREGGTVVTEIELVVGKLAGVEVESLKFCFSAAAKGTPAERATLVVDEREAEGVCEACGMSFRMARYGESCPFCGSLRVRIASGEELSVRSIAIE